MNVSASDNIAQQGGGVLFTSSPAAVQLAAAAGDSKGSTEEMLVRQLSDENRVAPGGYGPGAASLPAALSFLGSPTDGTAALSPGAKPDMLRGSTSLRTQAFAKQKVAKHELTSLTQQQQSPGRKLLQSGSSSSSIFSSTTINKFHDALTEGVATMYSMQSAAADATATEGAIGEMRNHNQSILSRHWRNCCLHASCAASGQLLQPYALLYQ
jgi:hypothetical protein